MADERSRGPGGPGESGEAAAGSGRVGRRRANEMVSWVVVGAMMLVGGGAVGYMYMQHRTTPTAARVHGATHHGKAHAHGAGKGKGAASTAGTGKGAGMAAPGSKAAAYYPPIGTPTRPVGGNVVEPFGWQYQKSIGLYRDVPGWALQASRGADVRAVIGGRVVANWVDPTEGREVVVNSKNGDSIIYGDLASPGPAVGTALRAGEVFAHVGPSGKLSGVSQPHLFLEVTIGGQPVSPSVLLGNVPGADAATATATGQGSTSTSNA
jgi:septal ring factor EnvC (AmiA/AmiB activator)